jgi:hypothetical protein
MPQIPLKPPPFRGRAGKYPSINLSINHGKIIELNGRKNRDVVM